MREFVTHPRSPVRHPRCDATSYRALGSFPRTADEAEKQVRARTLTPAEHEAVGVAYTTAADAVARRNPTNRITFAAPRQDGLRGGTLSFDDTKQRVKFDSVRYVDDAAVDGYVSYQSPAKATLTVHHTDQQTHSVQLTWAPYRAENTTRVTGKLDGKSFTAYIIPSSQP